MSALSSADITSARAELNVAAAILLDPSVVGSLIATRLEPEDFVYGTPQTIYLAASRLHAEGRPISLANIEYEAQRLGRGEEVSHKHIATLYDPSVTPATALDDAKLIIDHAARRRVVSYGASLASRVNDAPIEDVAASVEREIEAAIERARKTKGTPRLKDLVHANFARIEAILDNGGAFAGIPTGLPSLDSMLGCLRPANLIVVGARPGVGKSSWMLQLAREAATLREPVPAGVFSLEMTADELVLRLMAQRGQVDHLRLLRADLQPHEFQRVIEASSAICQWPIVIDDAPLKLAELRARARFMVREQGVKLIFVDYLQLVKNPMPGETREREVGSVATGLKEIAKELRVPIVALAQLSRSGDRRENRRPRLSDLRESGSIEQDADAVVFLHREPDAPIESDREKTEAIVAKNRHGPTGVVHLRFNGARGDFSEAASNDF